MDQSNPSESDLNNMLEEVTKNDNDIIVEGVFYYPYYDYAGWKGKIEWHNDIPVIGGRDRLWEGINDPQSLAKKLNSFSTDPTSSDSYSLIPVHVWSMDYNKVIETVSLLEEHVEVVLPEELLKRVKQRIKRS